MIFWRRRTLSNDHGGVRMQAMKKLRCFVHDQSGAMVPVDKLRFGVFNDEDELVSSLWTIFPAHNPEKSDLYATASGLHPFLKFSFHLDVINVSFLAESHKKLIEKGVIPDRSRHIIQVPMGILPWFGVRLRWANRALSRSGRKLDTEVGPVVRIPLPKLDEMLEIGFLITDVDPIKINNIDFAVGSASSGGRSLVVIGKKQKYDPDSFHSYVNNDLNKVKLDKNQIQWMKNEKGASVHLYGTGDDGELTVTEVHNVSYVDTKPKDVK